MSDGHSRLDAARTMADELLFPTALATDAADLVPRSHLDALAEAGLYGLLPDGTDGGRVVEALAGGCLTTAFVWIQHQGALKAVAGSGATEVPDVWLDAVQRGRCRAGIAVGGIRRSVAGLSAEAVPSGWRLNGVVPWVTGWGRIDVILTAARGPQATVVWTLLDAVESPTLTVARQRMVAVNASGTVTIRFQDHFVAEERVIAVEPYADWSVRDARGLRANASLALGVAGRCCQLLGSTPLAGDVAACRDRLDRAESDLLPGARAEAALLASRAAAAAVVASGSRSVLLDQHPQRLAREATFLLVFASRPAIRTALRQRLEGPAW